MEKLRRKLVLIVPVLLLFAKAYAIVPVKDTVTVTLDTVLTIQKVVKEPHSPHRATIYSMVLPGLGQIYNRQWWKVPILYGGLGTSVYFITVNNGYFKDYKAAYLQYSEYITAKAQDPNTPLPENPAWEKFYLGNVEDFSPQQQTNFKNQLNNRKINYKRNRDLLYIVTGAIYALNIIDATVFAHFYDFEIDEDLSMTIQPSVSSSPVSGNTVGVSLTINF